MRGMREYLPKQLLGAYRRLILSHSSFKEKGGLKNVNMTRQKGK